MYSASRFTFKQLVDEVLQWSGDQDDAAQMRTLVKQALRSAHERRLTQERYTFMVFPKTQRFTTVADQQSYSLHEAFLSPLYVWNVTQGHPVKLLPQQRLNDVRTESSTSLTYAAIQGVSKVKNQPASAGIVAASSTDAADFGKTVLVTGENEDGEIVQETLTLPNVGTTEFSQILDVVKIGDDWQGRMTLLDADSQHLLTLEAGTYGRQFRQLAALTPQAGGDIIEYQFYRQPKQLVYDNDIPDIPYPFDRILTLDALVALAGITRPSDRELQNWKSEITDLENGLLTHYSDGQSADAEANYQVLVAR
jgi:hypothetical protein